MKYLQLVCISVSFVLSGCGLAPNGSSVDRAAAQKVADSFMADLVADRVDRALDKMESEFIHQTGRAQAEAAVRNLFTYCGRPLDSEFKHDEVGFKVYPDGKRKPMRKFYYAATTTQHPKGECFFSVEVVPDQGSFRVTSFGPLTLRSGQLPDWLK
ncbi:MAG TPA: hypothetical protein VJV74_03350 [Terriglobia bacterium]|nr:hypothetical protein [Terriglobia bacterium]